MKAVPVLLLITLTNGDRSSWAENAQKEKVENIGPPPKDLAIPVFLNSFIVDGLIDPATGLKTPVNMLDLVMMRPKTEEARRRALKTVPLSNIQFIASPSPVPNFFDPRETESQNQTDKKTQEIYEPMWFNYAGVQDMNLNSDSNSKQPLYRYQSLRSEVLRERQKTRARQEYRDDLSTMSDQEHNVNLNWTTCDQFMKKTKFDPRNLLHINWLPFYTWSDRPDQVAWIHKFRRAPIKMVVRMKEELGTRLSYDVDWNQYKFVMENVEKILLIAADQTGLFHGIKDDPVPDFFKRNTFVKFPVKRIRFKFVEQYLAMMDCDARYATIMAPLEDGPKTDADKEKAAKALKFNGIGNPVSRDLEIERIDAETRQLYQRAQEEVKFIKLRDEDFVVPKDHHLDLWNPDK